MLAAWTELLPLFLVRWLMRGPRRRLTLRLMSRLYWALHNAKLSGPNGPQEKRR